MSKSKILLQFAQNRVTRYVEVARITQLLLRKVVVLWYDIIGYGERRKRALVVDTSRLYPNKG